jgi:hypothetical protein
VPPSRRTPLVGDLGCRYGDADSSGVTEFLAPVESVDRPTVAGIFEHGSGHHDSLGQMRTPQ